jgi:glycosyltransferase involved in cell wall biosynthesis
MLQSIDSCLNQTYNNIELIVVDDGSTDGTTETIKAYVGKKAKIIRHEKNLGLPQALNRGFSNAEGEYLTWTSDDNFYSETAIEKQLSFLKNTNCDFVYCDYYLFTDENIMHPRLVKLSDDPQLEKHNFVGPCVLYSRKVKDIIGDYDSETVLGEDYDYWIRASQVFRLVPLSLNPYTTIGNTLFTYAEPKYWEVKAVDIVISKNKKIQLLTDYA